MLVELQGNGETKETLVVLVTLDLLVNVGKLVCVGPLDLPVCPDKMVVKVLLDH